MLDRRTQLRRFIYHTARRLPGGHKNFFIGPKRSRRVNQVAVARAMGWDDSELSRFITGERELADVSTEFYDALRKWAKYDHMHDLWFQLEHADPIPRNQYLSVNRRDYLGK